MLFRSAEAEAAKLAAPEAQRAITAPTAKTDVKAIINSLPADKAEKFYIEAMSIPTMERTATENELITAIKEKYPQVAERFGGRDKGELAVARETNKTAADFKAGIDKRKQVIAENVKLDEDAKRLQIENINKALLAYEADPENSKGEFSRAIKAINDARGKGQKALENKAELEAQKKELEAYLGGGVKRKQELDASEEARTAGVERASTAILAAIAELQVLNEKRAKGSALTPNEAARVIQLRKYVGDTKELQQKLMTTEVANNPNIKQFVLDITKNFNEGKVPTPETKEERESRFNEELSAFDTQTAEMIKQEAVKAAKEIKNNYIDADQLRLLAVKAALSGDKRDAAVVLGALYDGKIGRAHV